MILGQPPVIIIAGVVVGVIFFVVGFLVWKLLKK